MRIRPGRRRAGWRLCRASASELLQQTLARDPTLSVSVAPGGSPSLFETVTVNCRAAAGCSRAKAVALRSLMEPYVKSTLSAKERDGTAMSMVSAHASEEEGGSVHMHAVLAANGGCMHTMQLTCAMRYA